MTTLKRVPQIESSV